MRAGRILIATLGLLALATAAHAECAFVLWQSYVPFGAPLEWHAMDTFETLEACKSAATSSAAATKSLRLSGTSVYQARCLPDTVDPRGPKGK
jgi:hypothetical protein